MKLPELQTAVIAVAGELDIDSVDRLWRRAEITFRRPCTLVHLDLSDVTFIGAAGVNTLVRIQAAADRAGVTLVLTAPVLVDRVLHLAGLEPALASAA